MHTYVLTLYVVDRRGVIMFFFFKQKTAYEMRISDWSSDVCSSDLFHAALKDACDRHAADFYPRFKQWCDEYFFIPHRGEARGVGGIFYDNLDSGDWESDFAFTQAVGRAFLEIYPALVRRHMAEPWTEEQRRHQLFRRGPYAEFNLLYDSGTRFAMQTEIARPHA